MCIYKYIFHTWYSQYSIFAQIWFCYLLFLVVLMQIVLLPSLILCLVTFDCEYMFFGALLKGLFETMHLNKDCVFGSTNKLGTFKMNYCVLGLREAMIVVKPSGILLVHRPALKSLLGWDLRSASSFCVWQCSRFRLRVTGFGTWPGSKSLLECSLTTRYILFNGLF